MKDLCKLPFEESIFTWQPKEDLIESRCYLRIYWVLFDRAVVIVSDLADNLGLSITDATQELITLVCNQFKLTHSKIMWLEYFPVNHSQELDIYYGVQLVSNQIIRYQLSPQYIKRLLKVTNDC